MPTIAGLSTEPYIIPMKSALKWGKGHKLDVLEHVRVVVRLSDGAEGIAEATVRPTIYGETYASIQHLVGNEIFPRIVGAEVNSLANIDAIEQNLRIIKNNNCAKGALNMALHEALAQAQGKTLAELLDISRTRIPVSYIVSTGTPDDVLADVQSAYDSGVRFFKVKIGADLATEVDTLKRLCKTYHDSGFYVDANQTLTINHVSLLDELHDIGAVYCEEPLPVHQVLERQQVHNETQMPLIGDDSCFTYGDALREFALDTIDIINIKTARNGFSEARAIAATAQQHNKGIMVGSQASSAIGCRHAALFSMAVDTNIPCECTFFLKTQSDQQLPIADGGYVRLEDL